MVTKEKIAHVTEKQKAFNQRFEKFQVHHDDLLLNGFAGWSVFFAEGEVVDKDRSYGALKDRIKDHPLFDEDNIFVVISSEGKRRRGSWGRHSGAIKGT